MKDKSVIALILELIRRPPMALIVIGVILVLISAGVAYKYYQITNVYWQVGVAALGIFLIVAGLLFLRRETLAVEKEKTQSKEILPAILNEPEKKPVLLEKSDLVVRVSQEMMMLTENYVEEVRQALFPNDLQEFLDRKSLPYVDRHLEWWEKAISTGQGPRGIPLTFLDKEKALQLFKLSSRISDIAQDSKQVKQVVVLGEAMYSQSDSFHNMDASGQREYRRTHLRDHIKTAIRLMTAASKCNTIPKAGEVLPR